MTLNVIICDFEESIKAKEGLLNFPHPYIRTPCKVVYPKYFLLP